LHHRCADTRLKRADRAVCKTPRRAHTFCIKGVVYTLHGSYRGKEVRAVSYMVARMQKMKAGNLVGIGNHNQRKNQNFNIFIYKYNSFLSPFLNSCIYSTRFSCLSFEIISSVSGEKVISVLDHLYLLFLSLKRTSK